MREKLRAWMETLETFVLEVIFEERRGAGVGDDSLASSNSSGIVIAGPPEPELRSRAIIFKGSRP